MTTKKTTPFVQTAQQEEHARLKRLERSLRRGGDGGGGGERNDGSWTPHSGTVSSPPARERDFLDGFDQSIGLFGDASVANGEAGEVFEYFAKDGGAGNLQLHLANVGGGSVNLMSHFVWNAALVMAQLIEAGDLIDVRDKRVIEFGAGAALPGLLSVQRGAKFVTLTDYPDRVIVQNLERNWYENLVETPEDKQGRILTSQESIQTEAYGQIFQEDQQKQQETRKGSLRWDCEQRVQCAVRGHAWGESVQEMMDCLPAGSRSKSGSPNDRDDHGAPGYDWILLADTLWVSEGHGALLKSCQAVLQKNAPGIEGGRILICCGMHTGFNTVQRFLALAQSTEFGFKARLVEIRRTAQWGETRTAEELAKENQDLKEEDLERFTVEDRNRTVLVYELWT